MEEPRAEEEQAPGLLTVNGMTPPAQSPVAATMSGGQEARAAPAAHGPTSRREEATLRLSEIRPKGEGAASGTISPLALFRPLIVGDADGGGERRGGHSQASIAQHRALARRHTRGRNAMPHACEPFPSARRP